MTEYGRGVLDLGHSEGRVINFLHLAKYNFNSVPVEYLILRKAAYQ